MTALALAIQGNDPVQYVAEKIRCLKTQGAIVVLNGFGDSGDVVGYLQILKMRDGYWSEVAIPGGGCGHLDADVARFLRNNRWENPSPLDSLPNLHRSFLSTAIELEIAEEIIRAFSLITGATQVSLSE